MATGKVKTLYSDKEKNEALFPRTKVSAVSDDNGTGLNVLLENISNSINDLDTIIAVDENTDGNIEFRTFLPEEDYVQIDKTLTTEGAAADAKAVGDKLESVNDKLVDYIVEQGTSGSWTYRKWSSGIAECWGTHKNIAIQGTASYGSIIYAGYGSVYLPSIFTEVTNINQSCYVTTGYDWCGKVMIYESTLTLYPMSGSKMDTSMKFTAYLHVHGKWK